MYTSTLLHVLTLVCLTSFPDAMRVNTNSIKGSTASQRNATRQRKGDAKTWGIWMKQPPPEAIQAYEALAKQAESAAAELAAKHLSLGAIDVVFSGGGNLDAYGMGVDMVLRRLQLKTKGDAVQVNRYAGASAGGMIGFDVVLKGERLTIASKIGMLLLLTKDWFPDQAAYETQAAKWATEEYASKLSTLDDRVYLALSCMKWKPLVMVHKYSSPEQARKAYSITGGMGMYDGVMCADGGSASGKKMTPLFQDALRPQLIVDLMAWGDGFSGVISNDPAKFQERIRKGIAAATTFIESIKSTSKISVSPNKGITLCPPSANVTDNVCKDPSASDWWGR